MLGSRLTGEEGAQKERSQKNGRDSILVHFQHSLLFGRIFRDRPDLEFAVFVSIRSRQAVSLILVATGQRFGFTLPRPVARVRCTGPVVVI